jgi:hypothetical protein
MKIQYDKILFNLRTALMDPTNPAKKVKDGTAQLQGMRETNQFRRTGLPALRRAIEHRGTNHYRRADDGKTASDQDSHRHLLGLGHRLFPLAL